MGTYRHLMVYFCCCSIVFTILDLVVQPNIQTYKSAFFLVVDVKRRNMNPWFARVSVYSLCGCFGVAIYGIAIHFAYRFYALERRGRVRIFQGSYLIIWFVIPLLAGAAWFIVTAEVYPRGPRETEYIRHSALETFGVQMEDCVYAAGIFFPNDELGNRVVNYWTFIGFACYFILMGVPFTIITIFGFKSWRIVNGLLEHGESEYSKNLQMQLYKALVAQTVIPMFFLFTPFGFLFALPIFEIDCQWLASLITLIFAIYPAVDPLPILYFIDYYRKPVIDFFKCKSNRVSVDSGTEGSITVE